MRHHANGFLEKTSKKVSWRKEKKTEKIHFIKKGSKLRVVWRVMRRDKKTMTEAYEGAWEKFDWKIKQVKEISKSYCTKFQTYKRILAGSSTNREK